MQTCSLEEGKGQKAEMKPEAESLSKSSYFGRSLAADRSKSAAGLASRVKSFFKKSSDQSLTTSNSALGFG